MVRYFVDGVEVYWETYLAGSVVTIRDNYTITGYTVTAWTAHVPLSIADGKFIIDEIDVWLYATSTINQYTITFNDGTECWSATLNYNSAVIMPIDPSKTGFTFKGWSATVPQTMPAEDVTLYAIWEINQYTIYFDSEGGSTVAAITMDYGSTIRAPNDPVKEGNLFLGWYINDTRYEFDKMPAENLTLHAGWSPRLYVISFTSFGVPIDGYPMVLEYGTIITMPTIIPEIRTDIKLFEFNEWIGFTEGMVVTQDVTFVASYTEIYVGIGEEGNNYFIDDDDVNSLTLREEVLDRILKEIEENPEMMARVTLKNGKILLDYNALSKLDNSKDDVISIQMREWDELPNTISSIVSDGRPVYKIGIGGITDFENGVLTIRLDYQLKDGESAENIKIWHFGSNGSLVEEECTYNAEGGYVEFTTSTLSHFAIMHIEPDSHVVETAICVILTMIIAMIMVVVRRQ